METRRRWTPQEDEWLMEHYDETGAGTSAEHLQRTPTAVVQRAQLLKKWKPKAKEHPKTPDAITIAVRLSQRVQTELVNMYEEAVRDMTMDEAVAVLAATVVDLAGRNLAVLMDAGYSVPTALDAIRELTISNYKEMHRKQTE